MEPANPNGMPLLPPGRVILHLDMDAFYASVEQRDNPAWQGKPVIVGSPPDQRGVVCAASYEARQFGVRSAMPSRTAGRLCPHGVFVRPRMDEYVGESRQIMAIVAQTGASIEQVSVDEAYLEFTAQCPGGQADERLQRALPIARELQARILAERQLSASIGIAANKMLAKLGSDFKKPHGLTLIPEAGKVAFLRPLPVRVLYGVGKVTESVLKNAGLQTVGDLQDYQGDLRALVGSFAPHLRGFAFGQDDRPLELCEETKSVSSENTFLRDTDDRPTLRATLWAQAQEIATELKAKHLAAKTVQVRVRYGDFTTLTRQLTLEDNIAEARDLYRLGCVLLARHNLVHRPLRLLGLGASGLGAPSQQLRLPFDNA